MVDLLRCGGVRGDAHCERSNAVDQISNCTSSHADLKKTNSNCFKFKFYIRWSCLRGQIEEWVLSVRCVLSSLHES
jgi:hypothetical protein